jgi:hypothetical protein
MKNFYENSFVGCLGGIKNERKEVLLGDVIINRKAVMI